tara:strand:+ start:42 stop:797 length:756 start_codon:yes stop_codon:yes gene_type:complete
MTINLDKLREKHAEMTRQGTGDGGSFLNNFLQIKEGSNLVRILPGKDEETEFYAETKIHRITGGDGQIRNFHCLKVHSMACPLCDSYFGLWKTSDKADEDTARQIKPRSRFYMNVVDRDTGEVKILSVGIMLFQKIVNAILDEDYGDITDMMEGHDFKIIKTMEGQWPKYDQSSPRPKPEAAGTDAEVATWMDSLHDIHGLVKVEEYEEVKQVAMTILPTLTYDEPVSRTAPQTQTADSGSDEDYLERLKS